MPEVSILIPCYNSEQYIVDCLSSCIQQSFTDWEIILVDDGSKDKSLDIVRQFAAKDNRIKVLSQPNCGACRARNMAFDNSVGKYIMYLDADDLISKDCLLSQVSTIESDSECDVAICTWDVFENTIPNVLAKRNTYNNFNSGLDFLIHLWSNSEMMAVSCYIFRRNVIEVAGKWDESLKKNQDGEFICRALLKSKKVFFNSRGHFYYRRGVTGSISSNDNREKVESILRSLHSCISNTLSIDRSTRIKYALAVLLNGFRYSYHDQYEDLSNNAQSLVKSLNVGNPAVGTQRFKRLSSLIGFDNMLRIRKLFRNKLDVH